MTNLDIHVALWLPGPVGGCTSENANRLEKHVTLVPAPRPSQLAATPNNTPMLNRQQQKVWLQYGNLGLHQSSRNNKQPRS
jgi:hypothetical protein